MRKPESAATTQEIFLRALDIPPAARSAFLDQACRHDPKLRAEIDSLLEHHLTHTLIEAVPPNKPAEGVWSVTTQNFTTGAAAVASTILGGPWRRAAAWTSVLIVLIGVA